MNNPFKQYQSKEARLELSQFNASDKNKIVVKYESHGRGSDMLRLITTVLLADKQKKGSLAQIFEDAVELSKHISLEDLGSNSTL